MGCDIHLHIEVKIEDQWQHYHAPRIKRNYALFTKMAGVRGLASEAIAQPRGLPDDTTVVTNYDALRWKGDGHSYSWLDAAEIAELSRWYEDTAKQQGLGMEADFELGLIGAYVFGNAFVDCTSRADVQPWLQDVRFVFWFDN